MNTDNLAPEIKCLTSANLDQFIELIYLFEEVFEMENFHLPSQDQLQRTLEKEDFFVFVALLEGKVVGGLTGYVLAPYYSVKPLAYIFDLAVKTPLQRRGIGQQIIAATNTFFRKKGFEEVFVQADKPDNYALDFYRKTQPTREEDVIHFSYVFES